VVPAPSSKPYAATKPGDIVWALTDEADRNNPEIMLSCKTIKAINTPLFLIIVFE
jgi:hypothetical protein